MKLSIKTVLDHAYLYGQFCKQFSEKKQAITFINSVTSYLCRNDMHGKKFTTELITCVNKNDQVVYFATVHKQI